MRNLLLLPLLSVMLFASCDKAENPYVDKSVIDQLVKVQNPDVEHVAIIYKNDVYYLENITKAGKRITNTPGISKKRIKMSHDYKKFAYLDGSGAITIVDINGQQIAQLTQYRDVKSFDWSADDKTLYILNSNSMAYYGPDMKLPEITYNGITAGSTMEVLSASVSMQGDFAYVIHGFNFLSGDKYRMVIKQASKAADIVFEDNSTYPKMQYVAFSTNKRDLVLGYIEDITKPDYINSAYVFINFSRNDDYALYSSLGLINPIFNESKSYAVTAYPYGTPAMIRPVAIGFNKQGDKKLTGDTYTSESGTVYTDWK